MFVRSQSFCCPKAGSAAEEYEDAAHPVGRLERSGGTLRYAVADGATETSFAGLWAELLVRGFVEGRPRAELGWLAGARMAWRAGVTGKPLPWYAEEKLRSGAFAALVGLELRPGGSWRALAAGDSCLFQVRADCLLAAFPLAASAAFTNRPALLGSNAAPAAAKRLTVRRQAAWRPGDSFYLMTDALAHWFLREAEDGAAPWETLSALLAAGPAGFTTWIEVLRRYRLLRNDDVTVLRVEMADLTPRPPSLGGKGVPTSEVLA
jgi:hypothetical protein